MREFAWPSPIHTPFAKGRARRNRTSLNLLPRNAGARAGPSQRD